MPHLDDPRRWIHRQLPLRLGIATLILLLGGGALSYRFETLAQTQALLGDARTQLATLVAEAGLRMRARGEDAPSAFFAAFERRTRTAAPGPLGRFVLVRFFSPDGKALRAYADPELKQADRLARELGPDLPARPGAGGAWTRDRRLGDGEFAHLVLPIVDPSHRVLAYVDALYRFSPLAAGRRRTAAFQGALVVALAILVTVLVLYPLVRHLVSRLEAFSGELLDANLATLVTLGAAIAKRDSDTDAHNYRVTLYALSLGEALGLPADRMRALAKGAFLHDVGKIAIPDRILLKPGRLDADEFALMRTHVQHGLDIVSSSPWLEDAAAVVGGHHEKVSGGGYPAGLKGEAIPLVARIFAIADVFDALTSERPYKEAFPLEKALDILREGAGSHFDAQILEPFLELAPRLYERYGRRDDAGLREALRREAMRWFGHDGKRDRPASS